MPDTLEKIHFTTRVLGPGAAFRLEQHQVTQTLRSESSSLTSDIINGRVSSGDRLQVLLDTIIVGQVALHSMDSVNWGYINLDDAERGGFDSLDDLEKALQRAGYRFRPLNEYKLYRIQFFWLEEAYA